MLGRNERSAVTTDEDKGFSGLPLDLFDEIFHLWRVGQIFEGEADRLRPEVVQLREQIPNIRFSVPYESYKPHYDDALLAEALEIISEAHYRTADEKKEAWTKGARDGQGGHRDTLRPAQVREPEIGVLIASA